MDGKFYVSKKKMKAHNKIYIILSVINKNELLRQQQNIQQKQKREHKKWIKL